MTNPTQSITVEASPSPTPDAELVEYLGGESEADASPGELKAPAQAAQPTTPDGAQHRDAQGRFTKTETPAASEEPPAPQETPEAPAEPVAKPFSYRAYGADHSPFDGATEAPDGALAFPPEAAQRLRQALAEGHNAESRRRTTDREHVGKLTSARGANAALVEQANVTLARLAELRRNPEALQQFFADLDRNWAILEAQAERDALKTQLERRQQAADEQAIAQRAEALRPHMRSTLEQRVGEMIRAESGLAHLDPAKMSERLWNSFFDRCFVEAEHDDPNGQYRAGEILIDYDAIRNELQYEASLRRTAPPPAPKPAEQKAPDKPKVTAPPVVTAKGAGATAAPKVPKFKTTKEADDWFESGGYHDL